ncbi:DUF2335 domain-containing protein [Ligilactobacillus acidipiscis]|uniref:DUF2335 domain-containing protein n=1 Tax=Ligilactobacillus acidipiscis TaxID=89059 RepID=A0A1K1KNW9_9LACO|nr:DUF2335 domain-containing protein [Ligilactobacillus acidipiscis]SFV40577.1 hypothetical protein LAC1533_1157 [Ligilactobacillus acidipiscis]
MNEEKGTNSQRESSNDVDQVVDKVNEMPDDQKEITMSKLEMYSGPIPHPRYLEQYENLDPGAAKLIIENGVDESKYRRNLESKTLEFSRQDHKRRDWMGFIIGIVAIIISCILIYKDHVVTGTIFGGFTVISLVSLFVGGNVSDEESSKDE